MNLSQTKKTLPGSIKLSLVALALLSFSGASLHAQSDASNWSGGSSSKRQSAAEFGNHSDTSDKAPAHAQAHNKSTKAPEARAARSVEASSGNIRTDMYNFTKQVPAKADMGETISYDYTLTPEMKLGSVVVKDKVPAGATFVSANPEAVVEGDNVTWNLGTVMPGEKRTLTMKVRADQVGTLKNCATVSAVPLLCTATVVGKPSIAITKTGPGTARLGQRVDFNITITNDGTSEARNVVVNDPVPSGLTAIDGKSTALTYNVGTLAPGQSRSFTAPFIAAQRGEHTNVATVNTSNAGSANASADIVVMQPGLTITKTGTKEQFVGKTASYTIRVENTGDTALSNVEVVDQVASPMRLVSAPGASTSGNTATWKIASFGKGQSMTYNVTTTSAEAGLISNTASVMARGDNLSATARANTQWKGFAALLIEVIDTNDPLLVGQDTVYVIRVTNQGSAADSNVRIVANFPEEVQPTTATGYTAGTVNGDKAEFAPVASLGSRQTVEYRVTARAAKEGDARIKVLMTSDLLQSPVTEEESTHVY